VTPRLRRLLPVANRAFDACCALALLLVVVAASNVGWMPAGFNDFLSSRITVKNTILLAMFLVAWNTAFGAAGLHTAPSRQSLWRQSLLIVRASTVGSLTLPLFALSSQSGAFQMWMVGTFWIAAIVVETAGRTLITLGARYLSNRPAARMSVVIVGSDERALRLSDELAAQRLAHYDILGFVESPTEATLPELRDRVRGTLADLESLIAGNPVDLVLVALPVRTCFEQIQDVINTCERVGVEVQVDLTDFFSLSRAKPMFDQAEERPALRLTLVTEDYRVVIKRLVDVCAAAAGIVVLAPLFVVGACLVRLSGPGPIFFSQARYGYNRRQFRMHKFRTMVADAERLQSGLESRNEAQGPVFKIRNDPRITPIGRFLRKTSIDELPQLFNVLKGEMSLVGPRPLPLRDVSRFADTRLMRRFSVRPGLTCLWQINGRSNINFDAWVQMDLAYIDNWSLTLDARILLKTVPAVISGSGAA